MAIQRGSDSSSNGINIGRYKEGWRVGKPVEDPEKLKKWGFIAAKPSEYLICIKDGKLNPQRSGQGARIFKRPWESVAVVPTTLQNIEFVAQQITRERVGVQVTGIAVYRITEPELAFRVLNFTYGERAGEKLAATLCEMFVGAVRRLVANLTLDECLMKRKEAIAAFLSEEIAPVLRGRGRPDDATNQGWGVVIDTIEIQDVKVLSKKVFEDLQAPFRAELGARAQLAELEHQREIAERRAAEALRTAEADIRSQTETRSLKARAEAETAETEAAEMRRAEQAMAQTELERFEREQALARKRLEVAQEIGQREAESASNINKRKSELAEELELAKLRADEEKQRANARVEKTKLGTQEDLLFFQAESTAKLEARKVTLEKERELELLKAEEEKRRLAAETVLVALQAEEQLQEAQHRQEVIALEREGQREVLSLQTDLKLKESRIGVELELRKKEAETAEVEAGVEAKRRQALAAIEQTVIQGRALRDLVNHGLPQIAGAFKQSFGSIHYTQLGGNDKKGGHPFGMVSGAFAELLTVAKSFGLDPSKLGQAHSVPTSSSREEGGTSSAESGKKMGQHA